MGRWRGLLLLAAGTLVAGVLALLEGPGGRFPVGNAVLVGIGAAVLLSIWWEPEP
jgi:hypothetical protein